MSFPLFFFVDSLASPDIATRDGQNDAVDNLAAGAPSKCLSPLTTATLFSSVLHKSYEGRQQSKGVIGSLWEVIRRHWSSAARFASRDPGQVGRFWNREPPKKIADEESAPGHTDAEPQSAQHGLCSDKCTEAKRALQVGGRHVKTCVENLKLVEENRTLKLQNRRLWRETRS